MGKKNDEEELVCNHTWGPGAGCDRGRPGLLCYKPRGDGEEIRVDLSCERFLRYHDHHGGILVFVAWELESTTKGGLRKELRKHRAGFERTFRSSFRRYARPEFANEENAYTALALRKYDSLAD